MHHHYLLSALRAPSALEALAPVVAGSAVLHLGRVGTLETAHLHGGKVGEGDLEVGGPVVTLGIGDEEAVLRRVVEERVLDIDDAEVGVLACCDSPAVLVIDAVALEQGFGDAAAAVHAVAVGTAGAGAGHGLLALRELGQREGVPDGAWQLGGLNLLAHDLERCVQRHCPLFLVGKVGELERGRRDGGGRVLLLILVASTREHDDGNEQCERSHGASLRGW